MERGAAMIKRFGFVLLLPAAMAFAPTQGQKPLATYRTEKGWLYIHEYDSIKWNSTGDAIITGAGHPMRIEETGNGMTITGTGMRLVIKANPLGRSYLEEATVTGQARVVFDSEVSIKAARDRATAANPITEVPREISNIQLDSETIVYKREGDTGVLTFPQPLTLVMDTKDRPDGNTPSDFTQRIDFKGTKGRVTAAIDQEGKFTSPQTVRLDGPATTTHLVRTDHPTAARPTPEMTDITATSDLMEFDFNATAGPTITATGNVHVQGQARGMPGEIFGSKAVVVLDKILKPASYEFTGEPSKVRVKVGGGR